MLVCYICTVPAHIIRSKARRKAGTTERRWPWKSSGGGETTTARGSVKLPGSRELEGRMIIGSRSAVAVEALGRHGGGRVWND